MDVVIRPVNDRFLKDVVFPAFETGVVDGLPALEQLLDHVRDDRTRMLVENLVEQGVDGSFYSLDAEMWLEAAYRLLFWEWSPGREGWEISSEYTGFAGNLDQTLHLALMIEDNKYPYWDEEKAKAFRWGFFARPDGIRGLASLICGRWDPFPGFPPDQALATRGRDALYDKFEELAVADWSCRSAEVVGQWSEKLAGRLANLIRREADRLRPVSLPEEDEIYDYWLGRRPQPPILTVAFSGLGLPATTWVREIGALAHTLRNAASLDQGVTSIIAPTNRRSESDPGDHF